MLIKFVIKVFAVLKILDLGPIPNNIRRDEYEPAKPCLKIYNQFRGIIIAEETDVSLKSNLRQHFWFTSV